MSNRLTDSYFYNFIDGRASLEIKAGQDGVTQAHIDCLLKWEANEKTVRSRMEEKETSFSEAYENTIGVYDETTDEEQEPELTRLEQLLRECVEKLRPEQQELYYEIMGNRRTYEEVAADKGITRQAIYSQMQTMKKNLKAMLEELM